MRMFNVLAAVGIMVAFLGWTAARLVWAGAAAEIPMVWMSLLAVPLLPVWVSGILALVARSDRAQRGLMVLLVLYTACLAGATMLTFLNPDPQAGMIFIILPIAASPILLGVWVWVVVIERRSRIIADAELR